MCDHCEGYHVKGIVKTSSNAYFYQMVEIDGIKSCRIQIIEKWEMDFDERRNSHSPE